MPKPGARKKCQFPSPATISQILKGISANVFSVGLPNRRRVPK
jgi:hypothetical protein